MKNNKGQAFVEAAFIFPIMVGLIFSVIWFARILLTWQQLISATRYGTDMIANTNLSATDIKKDIENYLTHKMIEGRRLDIKKIKEVNVDIKDFQSLGLDNIFDIKSIYNFVKGFAVPKHELSTVSITYSYDVPKILNFIGKKEFEIKTKLSVLAGSGCENKKHRRKEFVKEKKMLKNRKGQGMVEYILIIALAVIVVIAGIKLFGGTLQDKFFKAADKVEKEAII